MHFHSCDKGMLSMPTLGDQEAYPPGNLKITLSEIESEGEGIFSTLLSFDVSVDTSIQNFLKMYYRNYIAG